MWGTPRRALLLLASALAFPAAATPPADPEQWVVAERLFFPGDAASAARGQGMTTDGVSWYFSGTRSLEVADARFATRRLRRHAIVRKLWRPSPLSPIGLNHIGDIDTADGLLYIPLDSSHVDPGTGKSYAHPAVAIYRARDLHYTGRVYPLKPPRGTDDVASWVAVDAAAGRAYAMAYDHATALAEYDLRDFTFRRYIPLSRPVDQAQGGKILNGWIYFATDADDKALVRASLATGAVETVGALRSGGDQEIEGLSFRHTAAGPVLYVLSREQRTPAGGGGGIASSVGLPKRGDANGALQILRDAKRLTRRRPPLPS